MLKPILILLVLAWGFPAFAAEPEPPPAAPQPKLKQFLYVLRLTPRLHDDNAWTDSDKAVLRRHLDYFRAATERGQLILAGRTTVAADKTMGLVIFYAPDEEKARAFMNGDPCVTEKIMTAELFPYAVAFRAK